MKEKSTHSVWSKINASVSSWSRNPHGGIEFFNWRHLALPMVPTAQKPQYVVECPCCHGRHVLWKDWITRHLIGPFPHRKGPRSKSLQGVRRQHNWCHNFWCPNYWCHNRCQLLVIVIRFILRIKRRTGHLGIVGHLRHRFLVEHLPIGQLGCRLNRQDPPCLPLFHRRCARLETFGSLRVGHCKKQKTGDYA